MKIAIYHNLQDGGGLHYVKLLVNELNTMRIKVDIYTHQNKNIIGANEIFYYPLTVSKNIFQFVKQSICETDEIEKQMSVKIKDSNYNYIFIFPCYLQQCPNIINYLPPKITYYFYLESIREYYEKTSFNYYSIKKKISRLIRIPIKIQDHINCSKTKNIIADSYYSDYQLKKIYNQKSSVVQPGLTNIIPTNITIKNNKKTLSFGLLTMLKGHHISAQIDPKLKIYGSKSHEDIRKYIDKNIDINSQTISDSIKNKLFENNTFFFANQINEPFGLTTSEACEKKMIVIGRNEAGTSEIISNGNNGYLYETNNLKLSIKLFNRLYKKKTLNLIKTTEINWKNTTHKILDIISYV